MIETLTFWEIALVSALVVLNGVEAAAAGLARWKGLTTSVSRIVSHGLIVSCALVYAWLAMEFSASLVSVRYGNLADLPVSNWPYIAGLAGIAATIAYELIAHLRAIGAGLTQNVSRVATRVVMLILLVVMVGISELRWVVYLDRLEALSRWPAAAADTVQPTHGAWANPDRP